MTLPGFTVLLILVAQAQPAPPARLLRSTSGTRGSVQGSRYVVEDPRTSFVIGSDRQIVILFEWETAPGTHHCEASWRDPSGKVLLISPADFEARGSRFSAYWGLTLPESPTPGLWAVEATVDGKPAGVHTFQITEGIGDATAPRRRVLAAKEIYALASAGTVSIEAMGAQGEHLWAGSGFYVDDQDIVTSFQTIEGASSLRVTLPSGQRIDGSAVRAANRRQDWAVLQTAPSGATPLPLADKRPVSVGDRAVFLDVQTDGARTLQEVSVVGRRDAKASGARLHLSAGASFAAIGSPLLNDSGEVIGVMGGAASGGYTTRIAALGVAPMAVPTELLPDLGSLKRETFAVADLLKRGLAAPPVTRGRSVLFGNVGRGDVTASAGLREESQLSRRDGAATVQVTWDTSQKQEGVAICRVFDADNQPVATSEPSKIKVRAGQLYVSVWKFPLANFTPGIYRIDLTLGDAVAWRTFLTVTD